MISLTKLVKMVRKWQNLAAFSRKRISLPRRYSEMGTSSSNMSPVAAKGHFVVYTADQCRFMFPMTFLDNQIIRQLLAMSEEEFGLPRNGPITLPCDAAFMEYAISFINRRVDRDMEKALLMSIANSSRCSFPYFSNQDQNNQMLLACTC